MVYIDNDRMILDGVVLTLDDFIACAKPQYLSEDYARRWWKMMLLDYRIGARSAFDTYNEVFNVIAHHNPAALRAQETSTRALLNTYGVARNYVELFND